MGKINEQHLLDEIKYDIKHRDIIKAKLVLASLDQVGRETQQKVLFEVSRAEDTFSIPLLAGLIANNLALIDSFPQVKEIMVSKVLDSPSVLMNLLADGVDTGIKLILIETAGEIQMAECIGILKDILRRENDLGVIKKVIDSLGMIGDASAVEPISEYLYSNSRDVIVSSVKALGAIGDGAAVEKLYYRLGGETDIDLLVLNTISKLQIPEAYEKLNAILNSEYVHLRTAAKKKLVQIGSVSARYMIKNLGLDNPDVVIHSLNVLGDLGDSSVIPSIRKLLFNEPEDPNVRFAAYETLGRLPLDRGAFALAAGLEDPVDNVRSAAAKAIDRNYNAVLSGGIKNLIRPGDVHALNIISTIVDSQCEKIFLDLIADDNFIRHALPYLKKKVHPEVRARYAEVLKDAGYTDIAEGIHPENIQKSKGSFKVYAVDDSRMILNIYRTILYNLGCESLLFEFPASALESLEKDKPDIILTDLNMPDISGIDLTVKIRQKYTKEELPIVMVTTQDESKDLESAYNVGVNEIMRKPFTESQIGDILNKMTGYSPPAE